MTPPGQAWNEATLSEDPAVEQLRRLGYAYVAPEALDLELFEALAQEARGHARAAEALGLTETGFAIYGVLAEPKPVTAAEPPAAPYARTADDAKTALASLIEEQLAPQVQIVDWPHKDDVQREMRRLVKRQLRAASYGADKIDAVAERVVDVLKRRSGRSGP
jgi:type I restriction enzyme R subunit